MRKVILGTSFVLSFCLVIFSCTKDENPDPPEQQGPKISSFSPPSGAVGTNVFITGKKFDPKAANNVVKIGETKATVTSAKATEIFITVPEGATTGKISVTVNGKTDTGGTFTVTQEEEEEAITISLDKNTLELFTLDSETLIPTIEGPATTEDITWSSLDESVAIVDNNGMVTGISAGTTKVIADLGNDVSVECLITINASVFTVGSITDQGTEVATLWINGEANAISDGITDAVANDVFVHGQDIYVVGYKDDPNNESYTIAMLWKNGVSTELSDPGEETRAQATSIQVNGNDVYVGGYNFDMNTERYGGYLWLNGEKVVDAPPILSLCYNEGEGLYVSGGYHEEDNPITTAFVSQFNFETSTNLTDGTSNAWAFDVFANGSDVYAAGSEVIGNLEVETAKLWLNGEETILGDDQQGFSYARSVEVIGSDVYVGGFQHNGIRYEGRVWKNGEPIDYSIGAAYTYVYDLAASGESLYAAGYFWNGGPNIPVLWKDGVSTELETNDNSGKVLGLFVK